MHRLKHLQIEQYTRSYQPTEFPSMWRSKKSNMDLQRRGRGGGNSATQCTGNYTSRICVISEYQMRTAFAAWMEAAARCRGLVKSRKIADKKSQQRISYILGLKSRKSMTASPKRYCLLNCLTVFMKRELARPPPPPSLEGNLAL